MASSQQANCSGAFVMTHKGVGWARMCDTGRKSFCTNDVAVAANRVWRALLNRAAFKAILGAMLMGRATNTNFEVVSSNSIEYSPLSTRHTIVPVPVDPESSTAIISAVNVRGNATPASQRRATQRSKPGFVQPG